MARRVFAYLWLDGIAVQSRELIMLHKPASKYERNPLGARGVPMSGGERWPPIENADAAARFVPPHYDSGRVIFTGVNAGGAGIFNYPSAVVTRILLTEVEVDETAIDWHQVLMAVSKM